MNERPVAFDGPPVDFRYIYVFRKLVDESHKLFTISKTVFVLLVFKFEQILAGRVHHVVIMFFIRSS